MDLEQIVSSFVPAWGVCDFGELSEHLIACRAMSRVPKEAQSVIVCLFPYRCCEDPSRELSYYACVPDYHAAAGAVLEAMTAKLHAAYPHHTFVSFTDNSPIPEVYAAARAGLGMIGDHRLLIHPTFGSYVFIGEIVTDLKIPATNADVIYCEHCGACAAACPGKCLPSDNRDTCVSAVSQKKGELTDAETALLKAGGLVWGCDRCQEACPHNKTATLAPHPCFSDYTPALLPPDHPQFSTRAYAWRGKSVPYRNRELLK